MAFDWLSVADAGLFFWIVAALHVAGLASTFLGRLTHSRQGWALCHCGFLACLVCVAGATLLTIIARSDWWVWSGTTFSIMAVGGTAELGSPAPHLEA